MDFLRQENRQATGKNFLINTSSNEILADREAELLRKLQDELKKTKDKLKKENEKLQQLELELQTLNSELEAKQKTAEGNI